MQLDPRELPAVLLYLLKNNKHSQHVDCKELNELKEDQWLKMKRLKDTICYSHSMYLMWILIKINCKKNDDLYEAFGNWSPY